MTNRRVALNVSSMLEVRRHLSLNATPTNITEDPIIDIGYIIDYFGMDIDEITYYAMVLLIIHIICMNIIAVTTLIYGIVTPPALLSVHMIFSIRKNSRLLQWAGRMKPSKIGSRLGGRSGRRHAFSSSPVKSSDIAKNHHNKVDCSTYPYLLSLAISDLLIGLLIAPLQLHLQVNDGQWFLGTYFCDLWRALDIFFCTSSALHTSVLAVDRWWTITRADTSVASSGIQLQKTMLAFLWILSAMISFPVMYLWQMETPEVSGGDRKNPYACEPVTDPHFIILSTLVSFFMPLVLTIAFYVQIAILIRQRWAQLKKRTFAKFGSLLGSMLVMGGIPRPKRDLTNTLLALNGNNQPGPSPNCNAEAFTIKPNTKRKNSLFVAFPSNRSMESDNSTNPSLFNSPNPVRNPFTVYASPDSILQVKPRVVIKDPDEETPLKRNKRTVPRGKKPLHSDQLDNMEATLNSLKRHSKLIRAMAIVVVMYCICWFPLYSTLFVKAICTVCPDHDTWERLLGAFTWLGYANSGINPIIYFLTLEEFRILAVSMIHAVVEHMSYWPQIMRDMFAKSSIWWMKIQKSSSQVFGQDVEKGVETSQDVVISTPNPANVSRIVHLTSTEGPESPLPQLSPAVSKLRKLSEKSVNTSLDDEPKDEAKQPEALYPYYDCWGRPINALSQEATI